MQESLIDINLLEVTNALFKKRNFDFITMFGDKWHYKQEEALMLLTDETTEEFLYGGGAGGAKTWTGCTWLLFMCELFPETKWFIGREELKRITESTLITFYKVAKAYHCKSFHFNAQKNVIIFDNGSRIDLLELKYKPSDPMYERFGSLEYTGGFIEEGSESNFGAVDVLRTRIGRHLNDKYKILAKMLITCNPTKKWLYSEFYKPWKNGELKDGFKRFIQVLADDNPFIESGYIERLRRTKDKTKYQRLVLGNWDYDDNPYALCDYESIISIFENDHVNKNEDGSLKENIEMYLTADAARFGSDKARIGVWRGWELVEVMSFDKSKTTEIQLAIQALRYKWKIPKHNCIVDEDGVGGGIVDSLGIKGFVNGSAPFKENVSDKGREVPMYENLQTQCLVGLADKINDGELYVSAELSTEDEERITEELQTIERKVGDSNKIILVKKEQIRKDKGWSPDWRDMMLERKYFDYAEGQSNSMRVVK